jgi:hypothetical protein
MRSCLMLPKPARIPSARSKDLFWAELLPDGIALPNTSDNSHATAKVTRIVWQVFERVVRRFEWQKLTLDGTRKSALPVRLELR